MSVERRRTARRAETRQDARAHARQLQRQRVVRARRVRWVVAGVAAVVAVAAVGVAIVLSTRGQPGRTVPILRSPHVEKGDRHDAYNSTPPTSGPHWSIAGEAPVQWGIYQEQILDEAQVHNLEHGGVMIQYSCRDCPELVIQLESFYNRWTSANPLWNFPASSKIVIAPYYNMPRRISLTAWGRIDELDDYDEGRIIRFVEAFRDKGAPEAGRVP